MDPVYESELTDQIIKAAIAAHRELGPGLLESVYEGCLCSELACLAVPFARQVPVPISYKGVQIDCAFRADIIVADRVLIEVKSVERLAPIHDAQVLTYLKLSKLPVGLLMNFGNVLLKDGLRRFVN
jgi:GxxExxY protein